MNRDQILERLKTGICDITFVKVNGDIRDMKATLDEDIVGEYIPESPITSRQTVYDTEANAWRSFTWNKLIIVDGKRARV